MILCLRLAWNMCSVQAMVVYSAYVSTKIRRRGMNTTDEGVTTNATESCKKISKY